MKSFAVVSDRWIRFVVVGLVQEFCHGIVACLAILTRNSSTGGKLVPPLIDVTDTFHVFLTKKSLVALTVFDSLLINPSENILVLPGTINQIPLVDVVLDLNKDENEVIQGHVIEESILSLLFRQALFLVGILEPGEVNTETERVDEPGKQNQAVASGVAEIIHLLEIWELFPIVPLFYFQF